MHVSLVRNISDSGANLNDSRNSSWVQARIILTLLAIGWTSEANERVQLKAKWGHSPFIRVEVEVDHPETVEKWLILPIHRL